MTHFCCCCCFQSSTKSPFSLFEPNLLLMFFQVEKSLQRIHRGQKNAMYTTQKSIENKCGIADGWKELLMAVGFR